MNQGDTETPQPAHDRYPELAEIPGLAWTMLKRAVADRRHGFRTPTVCTVSAIDGTPAARTVVLRHADPESLVIRCHTDRRATKIADIEAQPVVAWHFYDTKSRTQLRCRTMSRVHTEGPTFEDAWQRTAPMSRRCYLAPNVPGSVSDEPSANLPDDLLVADPNYERSEDGKANFAVVESRVERMDWLLLKHSGHRRAKFEWGEDGDLLLADWLEP